MSIKIIRNNMTEPIEVTCSECRSIFSYTYNDIRREDIQNIYFGQKVVKRYVICHVCQADVSLRPKVVIGADMGKSDDIDASKLEDKK